jgi:hypothetical protein
MTRHALQERLNDTWYREQSADDASNAIWGEPFDGETVRISDFEAERTARKALEEALWRSNRECCQVGHTKSDQHDYDAPCPVEARIVAALTLASKLP